MEKYVLFNPDEAKINPYQRDECYGFWSNKLGYTVLEGATVFTGEMAHFRAKAMNCIAVKLPE